MFLRSDFESASTLAYRGCTNGSPQPDPQLPDLSFSRSRGTVPSQQVTTGRDTKKSAPSASAYESRDFGSEPVGWRRHSSEATSGDVSWLYQVPCERQQSGGLRFVTAVLAWQAFRERFLGRAVIDTWPLTIIRAQEKPSDKGNPRRRRMPLIGANRPLRKAWLFATSLIRFLTKESHPVLGDQGKPVRPPRRRSVDV